MIRIAACLVVVLGLAFVAGCGQEPTAQKPAPAPVPAGGTAAGTAAAKPYPLKVCIVSGEELGKMGEPYKLVHEGQEIKFCCKGCEPDFKKDPAKYLAKLQEPAKK